MIHTIQFKPAPSDYDYGVLSYIDDQPVTELIHEYEKRRNANALKATEPVAAQSSLNDFSNNVGFLYYLMYEHDPITVADLPLLNHDEAILLACNCGEWNCARTTVRVKVTNAQVHWYNLRTSFENRKAYPGFGPWTFDREQYQSACIDIHKHHRNILSNMQTTMFRPLEEQHLLHGTRSNREKLESILHESYTEIGASGRTYTRDQVIELLPSELVSNRTIQDFHASPLDPVNPTTDLIQTTYTLTRTDPDNSIHHSRRSSIWANNRGQWQLIFHQGTPI